MRRTHTFHVRARNAANAVDPSPDVWTWTIESLPETELLSAPPLVTNDTTVTLITQKRTRARTTATFEFTSSDANSTFECKLDGGAWTACNTGQITYNDLSAGGDVRLHLHRESGDLRVQARHRSLARVHAAEDLHGADRRPAHFQRPRQGRRGRYRSVRSVQAPAPPADCGTEQTLTANADAWIDQGGPTANKGTDSILKVNSKSGSNMRALVRFLLPTLPAGCAVESAKLRLHASSAKDGRTIQAIRVNEAWSENVVTWGNQPQTIGGAATTSSGSSAGYREWDVASAIAAMYSSGEHNGFLIRDANENQDSEQQYNSREKSSDQPQLVVKFGPAAPPPPPDTGDTTPPDTSITQGPSNSTTSTSAHLVFEADEAGATLECRLDSEQENDFAACESPKDYTGLEPGSCLFEVRAVDAAGNKDQTPALHTWTITSQVNDTTPPETTLTDNPPATTQSKEATFKFMTNENDATFECKLDSANFDGCTSPTTLLGLSVGEHTFQVRAKDAAGNVDLSPESYTWTIEPPPPPNCGTQQTIGASADAWVEEGAPNNNKCGDSTLKVVSKSGNNARTYIRFNLPAAPAGCVLDTAMLRMYSGGYKEGRTIEVLRADADWSEGGVTWANQPGTNGSAATTPSGNAPGYREWDVFSMVQAMLSGSNYGFVIRDANEGQDAEQQYNSREKSSDQPQLVIKFKVAP